jgi:hypothetical protein
MWEFRNVGDRLELLTSPPSFEEIVTSISREAKILCVHADPCTDCPGSQDQPEFSRPFFCLQVGRSLFDLFFNAVTGYRAAYYRSPFAGLEANGFFLDRLRPKLVESWPPSKQNIDPEDALNALSAKVWLAEVKGYKNLEGKPCEFCRAEWEGEENTLPEIYNGRWEVATHANARSGRKAPYLTKLHVLARF